MCFLGKLKVGIETVDIFTVAWNWRFLVETWKWVNILKYSVVLVIFDMVIWNSFGYIYGYIKFFVFLLLVSSFLFDVKLKAILVYSMQTRNGFSYVEKWCLRK